MNPSDQIIITVKKMKDGTVSEEKDMSVPVTAKISEIFPGAEVKKKLSESDSFQAANILYGEILEISYPKGR